MRRNGPRRPRGSRTARVSLTLTRHAHGPRSLPEYRGRSARGTPGPAEGGRPDAASRWLVLPDPPLRWLGPAISVLVQVVRARPVLAGVQSLEIRLGARCVITAAWGAPLGPPPASSGDRLEGGDAPRRTVARRALAGGRPEAHPGVSGHASGPRWRWRLPRARAVRDEPARAREPGGPSLPWGSRHRRVEGFDEPGPAAGRAVGPDHAPRPRRLDQALLRGAALTALVGPGAERRDRRLQGGAGRRGRQWGRSAISRPTGPAPRSPSADDAAARTLQLRLAVAFASTTFSPRPPISPRTSRSAELEARYGGGGRLFRRYAAEVEMRLWSCPAYRALAAPSHDQLDRVSAIRRSLTLSVRARGFRMHAPRCCPRM